MVFPCNQCGKVFHSQANLRDHTMTHTGERVACPEENCHATFSNHSNLRRHDREYHEPRRRDAARRAERARQQRIMQDEMDRVERENRRLRRVQGRK